MREAIHLLREVANRLEVKNAKYGGENPFLNFDTTANAVGDPPWRVASLYAWKHIAWLAKVTASGERPSAAEAREHLGDIAAYMAIIFALIVREEG